MTELIILLLTVATILYAMQTIFLVAGLLRSAKSSKGSGWDPQVSIIVAARNEEEHIERCLSSLIEVDYPREKLEVIIVNDRSTDKTPQIVDSFARRHSFVKLVSSGPEEGNLRGKTNAVTHGIDASHGEILMFTDADCSVPRGWVREILKYYDNETGIVGGFTVLTASSAFEGMQALDWIYLFGISSATAGWGVPLTAIGNNISVRRSAYLATGGYRKIPFSITEDYALVRSVLNATKLRLKIPLNPESVVTSRACQTAAQLFRQKQRWGVGGLDMVPFGVLLMAIGWVLKLLLLAGFVAGLWFPSLIALVCKSLLDALLVSTPLRRFRASSRMLYFPLFELYFIIYVLILPPLALFSKRVVWKERSF